MYCQLQTSGKPNLQKLCKIYGLRWFVLERYKKTQKVQIQSLNKRLSIVVPEKDIVVIHSKLTRVI